jgi:hypothetical protein
MTLNDIAVALDRFYDIVDELRTRVALRAGSHHVRERLDGQSAVCTSPSNRVSYVATGVRARCVSVRAD